jgi:hypothetical protein
MICGVTFFVNRDQPDVLAQLEVEPEERGALSNLREAHSP